MKQFNLSEWLKDKSRKVVTRSGIEAEIIHDKYPLVAIINGVAYNFDNDGKFQSNRAKHPYDLFFADEEEELTEFDKCLLSAFYSVAGKAVTTIGPASFQEDVDEWSKPLIDLARKELEKEDWRTPLRLYKNAYEQGKQDALKDLPKLKKATEHKKFGYYLIVLDASLSPCVNTEVFDGDYYIELKDLKTLQKEE